MADVREGTVEVQMDSKYQDDEVRVKIGEDWFGAKSSLKDDLKAGYKVKVMVEKVGEKTLLIKKVKVLEKGAPPAKGKRGGGGFGGGGFRKEDPETVARITISNSRTSAIATVVALLSADVLPLGSGKKSVKEEIILDAIDRITFRYLSQTEDVEAFKKGIGSQAEESSAPELTDSEEEGDDSDFDTDPDDF